MNKLILGLSLMVLTAASAVAVPLGGYNFTTDLNASSSVPGLTFSGITTGGGATATRAATSGGILVADGFDNDAGLDRYVQFTITAGGSFTLENIAFTYQRILTSTGNAGPAGIRIEMLVGATTIAGRDFTLPDTAVRSGSLYAVNTPTVIAAGQVVTIRIYGFNSGSSGNGDLNIDDIAVSGVAPVPEPTNIALGVFGVAIGGVFLRRKLLKNKELTVKA